MKKILTQFLYNINLQPFKPTAKLEPVVIRWKDKSD